jgi:hypothetical protein
MVCVIFTPCLDTHSDFNYGHRYFEDNQNYHLKTIRKINEGIDLGDSCVTKKWPRLCPKI